MRKQFLVLLVVVLATTGMITSHGLAANPQRGLQINPLRDFQTVEPGQQKTGNLSVINLSSQPELVTMSVKTFSVTDYTYDYKFSAPKADWIHFSQDQVELQPGQTADITYYLNPDKNATPGGYYYTLVASTTIAGQGSSSTVQAATLLYLTIDGDLIKTGDLSDAQVQRLVFGKDIGYSINAHNSGNVHYFIAVSSKLYGIFTSNETTPTSHLLLPNTTRRIQGSVPSPVLPGLYRVAITYRTDGGINQTSSRFLFYIPPWFIAVLLGGLLVYNGFRKPKQKPRGAPASKDADD